MTSLLDTAAIEPAVELVLKDLAPGAVVVVGGPEGAGRGEVVARVSAERRTLHLEAPPLTDPDAGVHLLFQLLGRVPIDERASALDQADLRSSAFEATRRAIRAFGAEVLALRLPRSWERLLEAREEDDSEVQYDRVREVLRGIQDCAVVPLLVLCGAARHEWKRWLRSPRFVRVPAAKTRLDLLDDDGIWDRYATHARRVRAACARLGAMPTPLQARLLVGVVALGVDPMDALSLLDRAPHATLRPLLRTMRRRITETAENSALRDALGRLLVARSPLPSAVVDELTRLPEHRPFFRECIGYSARDAVKITEVVRDELREPMSEGDGVTHEHLVTHYKSLDGVPNARDAAGAVEMAAWLERAHHAALLTDPKEWAELDPPCPEFYWARGRSLSRVFHKYAEAAAVYGEGVRRFPTDGYGWHYYAFNLDLAGGPSKDIDGAFRRAIETDETNRWYNSRLVTFLIRRAQYDRADTEYLDALTRLGASGNEAGLAPAYHRWIVREWLEQGEVGRARAVYEDIPEEARRHPGIVHLHERLLDAEEALALGVSVYPAGQRFGNRWKRPTELPTQIEGATLDFWYPAYVDDVTEEHVVVRFATPDRSASERRVFRRQLSRDEWSAFADDVEPSTASWIFIGRYGDTTKIVMNPASADAPSWEEQGDGEISEYLRA